MQSARPLRLSLLLCFVLALTAASCNPGGGGGSGSSGGSATGPGPGGTGGSTPAALLRWNEYDHEFVFPARRAWNDSFNDSLSGHNPHHNGYDLFLQQGQTAPIEGKFHYGDLRKDLEGEEIGLYVREAGGFGWTFVADETTDGDGRVSFAFPAALIQNPGRYFVRMVVYGDLSFADAWIRVIDQPTPAVVFDIDGTLTTADEQMIQQVLGDFLDLHYVPRMFDDAAKAVCQLARAGYEIVYTTARPYWLSRASRVWLMRKGFPVGNVYTYPGAGLASGQTAVDYKRDTLLGVINAGATFDYAFGNADSDIDAYAQAGIQPADTYILGPLGGQGGTIALPSYTDLFGNLIPAPDAPYRVVMIVIDGLRPDALRWYMQNLAPANSALVRLFGGGVDFADSATVAPSVTFANHAAIVTGCTPNHNGITGNMFFDRAEEQVYSLSGDSYDIQQVASVYQDAGFANRALQTETLYEQMSASGFNGASVAHMYYTGAEFLYPSLTELATYLSDGRQYDADMMGKAIDRFRNGDTPDLFTIYLPGLDHEVHEAGNVGGATLDPTDLNNSQLDYLYSVIDPLVGDLETALDQLGLLDDTVFLLCSDHGMSDVIDDDAHAVGFDMLDINDEIELVLENSPYTDCYDKPGEDAFDCFAGVNGGLLHINLQNLATHDWHDAPRFSEDVVPVLAGIGQHRLNGELFQAGEDVVEEVLVRTSPQDDYQVVRSTRVRVHFDSALVIDDEDGSGPGDLDFSLRVNGREYLLTAQVQANDGDTVTFGRSFDVDLMPGMELAVQCFGRDDDGLYYESLGLAQQAFADRSAVQPGAYAVASDEGDFELNFRVELVQLATYSYAPLPGFGNLCPLTVLSPEYLSALTRIPEMNHPERSGDIVLLPRMRQGFCFGAAVAANHGSLYPEDSTACFFLGGRPLAQSGQLQGNSLTDIAPTVAHILGFELRRADGRSRVDRSLLPLLTR